MGFILKYKGVTLCKGKVFETKEKTQYQQGLIIINYGYCPEIVEL